MGTVASNLGAATAKRKERKTLIENLLPSDSQQAMLDKLHRWAKETIAGKANLKGRNSPMYAVASMCRILYALHHGAVVSEPVAVSWVKEILGEQWTPFVEEVQIGREHNKTANLG